MKEAVVGTRGENQAESTAPACMGVTGFDRGSTPRTSTSLDFRFGDEPVEVRGTSDSETLGFDTLLAVARSYSTGAHC